MGASVMRITRTVAPGAGRPTQVPAPLRVSAAVSPSTSWLPMLDTGRLSVAP